MRTVKLCTLLLDLTHTNEADTLIFLTKYPTIILKEAFMSTQCFPIVTLHIFPPNSLHYGCNKGTTSQKGVSRLCPFSSESPEFQITNTEEWSSFQRPCLFVRPLTLPCLETLSRNGKNQHKFTHDVKGYLSSVRNRACLLVRDNNLPLRLVL